MPIKLRILIIVLLLQVLGFGILLAWGQRTSHTLLSDLRRQQVAAVFAANASEIDVETSRIERSALDLAVVGETLHALKRAQPALNPDALVESQLVRHFRNFPEAIGGGLWYEPKALDPARRLYGPYAFWQDGEVRFTWDLSQATYNYPDQEWYQHGLPRGWPRDIRRPQAVYWSTPYYDEAGTLALMMTADVPMYSAEGRLIGMSTVDWSLEEMRRLISRLSVTPGSKAFLIEPQSGRFVSNTMDESLVMMPTFGHAWAEQALHEARPGELGSSDNVDINGRRYLVQFMATRIGLVFGAIIPREEILGELRTLLQENLIAGVVIAAAFVLLMMFALGLLFRPFNRMLDSIVRSIRHDPATGQLALTSLTHTGHDEFAPIVAALNEVYNEVGAYTAKLSAANDSLRQQQDAIGELNQSLERKVNERTHQLEAKNAELHRMIDELRNAQGQLADAEKHVALNRLVAGIAHEVNTPLGIAVTAGSHLADNTRTLQARFAEGNIRRSDIERYFADATESCAILSGNLERAARLVRSFKQISVDQSSEVRRRFQLHAYLDDIILSLRPQLKRTRHTVEIDCPEMLEVDSFPGAVSQIVTNLVMNSLIHGFRDIDQGVMRLRVVEKPNGIEMTYSDNGRGISAENLPQIFDPFFTTNRNNGGSGLGLNVVYNLVTRTLGGSIRCHSSPGKGAQFIIELPTLPPPDNGAEPAGDAR